MKKILITQRLVDNESYPERRETLDICWGSLLNEISFLPIVLPYQYNFKNYFKEMTIDGIILTGGNDLNSLNKNSLSNKRDIFEKKLISYAIKKNIPILGVCRGMQLIAEYFGSIFKRVDNQIAIYHTLNVNYNSKYFNFLKDIKRVNSFHNYAICNVGDDLLISATDSNGIIKAIEHKKYKIFGQMWHSEREKPFNKNELKFIKEFFNHVE